MGYIESWIDAPRTISGAAAAREAFTVSESATSISSAWVRLMRVSGTSPLDVRLETASGGPVDSAAIPAESIPLGVPSAGQGSGWAQARFGSSHTLEPGASYNLVLTAPSDTLYSIFSLERGNTYGFASTTYFGDGYSQYTTDGVHWSGFDQPGGRTGNTNSDLQFYFGQ